MRALITGGAGFIGSALAKDLFHTMQAEVCVIDKMTYASNIENLGAVLGSERFRLERLDINDRTALLSVMCEFRPSVVFHLAAETHVDRSISDPAPFVHSNVLGTFSLLETCQNYLKTIPKARQTQFRFVHVSTDEVWGSTVAGIFNEESPHRPNSPYSATKSSSDMLVRSWQRTYGFPAIITNCSNNFGPGQHNEKLIPKTIDCAIKGESIPVYGTGKNVRDWLYVGDHVRALKHLVTFGEIGETYAIGGGSEMTNLEIVNAVCDLVDRRLALRTSSKSLITFVEDRPGHDFRYAVDSSKIRSTGWFPEEGLARGLQKTVDWYCRTTA